MRKRAMEEPRPIARALRLDKENVNEGILKKKRYG